MKRAAQHPTNKMLRREIVEVLDPQSPTCSAIMDKLSARDTAALSSRGCLYWRKLTRAVEEALAYGWAFGVNAPGIDLPNFTPPPDFSRAERHVIKTAVVTAWVISGTQLRKAGALLGYHATYKTSCVLESDQGEIALPAALTQAT